MLKSFGSTLVFCILRKHSILNSKNVSSIALQAAFFLLVCCNNTYFLGTWKCSSCGQYQELVHKTLTNGFAYGSCEKMAKSAKTLEGRYKISIPFNTVLSMRKQKDYNTVLKLLTPVWLGEKSEVLQLPPRIKTKKPHWKIWKFYPGGLVTQLR